MADKFACTHCGFIFEDPDMEVCPRCGTELGQEWDPAELVDIVVTDTAGADIQELTNVISEISGSSGKKTEMMLKKFPAVVFSGATPLQAECFLEQIRATKAAAMSENSHEKSARIKAELEASASAANVAAEQAKLQMENAKAKTAAESKAKMEAEERIASLKAKEKAEARAKAEAEEKKTKTEAEVKIAAENAKRAAAAKEKSTIDAQNAVVQAQIQADAKAEAEALAEKSRLDADIAKASADADARAKVEFEKYKLEFEAKQAQKRKRWGCLWTAIIIPVLLFASLFVNSLFDLKKDNEKNRFIADLEVMLKHDPFLTFDSYSQKNPGKLSLALFDQVYQKKCYADARANDARKKQEQKDREKAERDLRSKLIEEACAESRKETTRKLTEDRLRKIGTIALPNNQVLYLRFCPSGTFTMGSPADEPGRDNDETQHEVTIKRPFLIGTYPVVQEEYEAVMGKNPSKFKSSIRPVECVTWYDAMAFCKKLNKYTEGKGIRPDGYEFTLPTEEQWEYACRAGTKTTLPNGKNFEILGECNAPALHDIAWYAGNCGQDFELSTASNLNDHPNKQFNDSRGGTHPVGKKTSNSWGISDMLGNVSEMCFNGPDENQYFSKGGSYWSYARICRPASRFSNDKSKSYCDVGFRIVLAPVK